MGSICYLPFEMLPQRSSNPGAQCRLQSQPWTVNPFALGYSLCRLLQKHRPSREGPSDAEAGGGEGQEWAPRGGVLGTSQSFVPGGKGWGKFSWYPPASLRPKPRDSVLA